MSATDPIVLDPRNGEGFEKEVGWRKSLFRYIDPDDDFIDVARSLMTRDFTAIGGIDLKMTFHPNGWQKPLVLDFSVPNSSTDPFEMKEAKLPGRVVVLVGRNGSGKSTILARLARVVQPYIAGPDSRDARFGVRGCARCGAG